ncbi:MAG: hypothetical protein R3D30_01105 [Hyphomicrobiales bacterium]
MPHSSILWSLSVACVAGTLLIIPARAEPEPEETPVEEESADESFVKGLIGTSYSDDLDLEGWTDFGGGLVAPPIYVHLYQREDGTSLVVTSKLGYDSYVVTDALIISKPWKGYAISIACTKGDDFTLRFIGDARGPADKEWWTEVRRAWEIEIGPQPDAQADEDTETDTDAETETKTAGNAETETEKPAPPPLGQIAKTETRGIKCANSEW